VIEFQDRRDDRAGHRLEIHGGRIPFIAIDIPHPGATYFGANNYQGRADGRTLFGPLGEAALGQRTGRDFCWWNCNGRVACPRRRIRGILTGVSEVMRIPEACRTVVHRRRRTVPDHAREGAASICGSRRRSASWWSGPTNPSALGALRAFQEGRPRQRMRHCRTERRIGSARGIALAAYPADCVGSVLPREVRRTGCCVWALDILGKKAVPPAVFTTHQIITPENVDHFYPTTVC